MSCGPKPMSLRSRQEDIDTIAEEFGLHPLAVEDAVNTRQRPKVESYEGHLFIVFHQLDEVDGQLEARQIACFIGDRFVLALHDHADRLLETAKKRFSEEGARLDSPAFLVYTMLDVVVDDYQEKADSLELETEELEEFVLASPDGPHPASALLDETTDRAPASLRHAGLEAARVDTRSVPFSCSPPTARSVSETSTITCCAWATRSATSMN